MQAGTYTQALAETITVHWQTLKVLHRTLCIRVAAGTRRAKGDCIKQLLLEIYKAASPLQYAVQAGGHRKSHMSKLLQLPCRHGTLIVQKAPLMCAPSHVSVP